MREVGLAACGPNQCFKWKSSPRKSQLVSARAHGSGLWLEGGAFYPFLQAACGFEQVQAGAGHGVNFKQVEIFLPLLDAGALLILWRERGRVGSAAAVFELQENGVELVLRQLPLQGGNVLLSRKLRHGMLQLESALGCLVLQHVGLVLRMVGVCAGLNGVRAAVGVEEWQRDLDAYAEVVLLEVELIVPLGVDLRIAAVLCHEVDLRVIKLFGVAESGLASGVRIRVGGLNTGREQERLPRLV